MATSTKKQAKVRDLTFAGYQFQSSPMGTVVHREIVRTDLPGDYGRDPLGDGTFRMVPSGDVVSYEESERRLVRRLGQRRQNRSGLSASRKRSPMLGVGTLADYEAAARYQQQGGPGGTLATGGRQTVAMTPGGTVVNRAGMKGAWGFYARRGSDSKVVKVSRALAEQIAESPAGTREDYLLLWLVPPFYMDAGEGKYRAEKGFVPVAWEYLRGKQDLPDDFLSDPRAWLERVKREDYPHYETSEVGASPWNLGTVGARRRARGLRSMNMAGGGSKRGKSTDLVDRVMDEAARVTEVERETQYRRRRRNRAHAPEPQARLYSLPRKVRDAIEHANYEPIVMLHGQVVVYRYDSGAERAPFGAVAFVGKQSKPTWHHIFRTEAEMDRNILGTVQNVRSWKQNVAKQKQAQREFRPPEVGEVFSRSWGYDQTNVDFVEVVSVSKTGKTATVVPIVAQLVGEGGGSSELVIGTATRFGGRTAGSSKKATARGGSTGDEPVLVVEGDRYYVSRGTQYRTGSGWGH